MVREYRARIFRAGNSLALRLPKAVGLAEGEEIILRDPVADCPFVAGVSTDCMAALAHRLDATVITRNLYDFNDVPDLNVEDWAV